MGRSVANNLVIILLLFLMVIMGARLMPVTAVEGTTDQPEVLPVVGSYENLLQLVRKSQEANPYYGIRAGFFIMGAEKMAMPSQAPSMADQAQVATEAAMDYSTTNVQVAGVDE
ncbi:MAG TPA: hypothetical protein GX711_00400, partial [Clostridia bacterium]|nr:hypothetical protein [Clostridia bacterium]